MTNLSPQRLVVLAGLANGKSQEEMAKAMGVTVGTIKSHVSHLFRKLKANDRSHAVGLGFKYGYLVPRQIVGPGECPGVRTSPNWCSCSCRACMSNRCDQHGGVLDRLERLGAEPSYLCFSGRHTSCTETACTCTCGSHNEPEENE